MKQFKFRIDRFQADQIFSPIRTKADVIMLWMNAIKIMLAYVPVSKEDTVGAMELIVAKMSRIFFATDDKVFSLNFPFFVSNDGGELAFSMLSCPSVDNKVTSDILSLLHTDDVFAETHVLDFAEPINDLCDTDNSIWGLFRDLMLSEEGYIRYEHDPKLENDHFHPLDHLDIFYSNASTFKVGCKQRISLGDLTDILNRKTVCHYIIRT
ncbi:MAG: hypothetical protein K8I29_02150 [Alphaproteobacteria bacterium]|uniref:Uncharacterized protein n=1 Tax=Candidatus Nitrobium versatile TaxID=2884831 RepID=A0A953J9G7_9BACT|nr:hypothetical protein [Candidatus Nitrobium versatile]